MLKRRDFIKWIAGGVATLSSFPALAAIRLKGEGSNAHKEINGTVQKFSESLPLQERYTFESFVVGSSNQFVHAAAMAVSDNPGKTFNPLLITGGVGVGKTHLLHAIGHRVLSRNSKAKVIYVTSKEYINEFANARGHGTLSDFREKYREADVLLIDDIQFTMWSKKVQEELLDTFDSLHESHKQIVFTSNYIPWDPWDIHRLCTRLISKFESGLKVDFIPPDIELRVAIVRSKAAGHSLNLPDDVVLLIAEHYKNNISGIRGAITTISTHSRLTGKGVTLPLAKEVLGIGRFV